MPDPAPDAPDNRPPLGPIEYRFPPVLPAIRLARHVLANWLEIQPGVDTDAIDDLLVVCSELCTNAINHATGAAHTVALRAAVEGDAIVLEIEDDGAGFSWPNTGVIGDVLDDQEHGRGLYIVEAITDHVEVVTSRNRTVVRCTKRGVLRHPAHSVDPSLSERFRAESHPADTNR
jgi:serine/threonine-protein kinase RsbW